MLSREREPRRLIFLIFISNVSMCPRFSFVMALTEINKVNDFRVPRDLQVKYKFIFKTTLSSASPSQVLKLPNEDGDGGDDAG